MAERRMWGGSDRGGCTIVPVHSRAAGIAGLPGNNNRWQPG